MELQAIQRALGEAGLDGWLFYDFHHRDPLAYRILGLGAGMTTRRWFYLIPVNGEPRKLSHRVEPRKLDPLPGRQEFYLPHTELREKVREMLAGCKRVAMQYSPMNHIPYVAIVDAGTVELVRSFGVEVVSSADLVQRFDAAMGDEGWRGHAEVGEIVQAIKDEAFEEMGRALLDGRAITEFDLRQTILRRFDEEGLTCEEEVPIVGFNDHPADPHFEPTFENAYTLRRGDTILLDLWARRKDPPSLYYDITWCAYAGDEPPAQYLEIWRAVCEARDAGLEFVRRRYAEGAPVRGFEVDDVVRGVVAKAGYADRFLHRTGHSIGTQAVHGTGANLDNLETRDERMLIPGTAFSIEPGIYLDGSMAVRTEIDVCITPAGKVEVFGPIQQQLVLI